MQFFTDMNILALSALAGVVGMGLGGLLSALLGNKSEKMVSILLSLAGGVMIAIVLFELIPESYEYAGPAVAILGLIAGAAVVWGMSFGLDRFTSKRKGKTAQALHGNFEEFYHSDEVVARQKGLLRAGLVMMFALGIHNVPEGIAMGAAGNVDSTLGFTLALMIALHNIPEGMAMATPMISGGVGRWKTVLLSMLTGLTTIFGAVIGMFLGGISEVTLALSFAFAGGAMLYVVFGEMLPHSIAANKSRVPTVVMLAGIVLGFMLTLIH